MESKKEEGNLLFIVETAMREISIMIVSMETGNTITPQLAKLMKASSQRDIHTAKEESIKALIPSMKAVGSMERKREREYSLTWETAMTANGPTT